MLVQYLENNMFHFICFISSYGPLIKGELASTKINEKNNDC